jgi:hypothetical protein
LWSPCQPPFLGNFSRASVRPDRRPEVPCLPAVAPAAEGRPRVASPTAAAPRPGSLISCASACADHGLHGCTEVRWRRASAVPSIRYPENLRPGAAKQPLTGTRLRPVGVIRARAENSPSRLSTVGGDEQLQGFAARPAKDRPGVASDARSCASHAALRTAAGVLQRTLSQTLCLHGRSGPDRPTRRQCLRHKWQGTF